MKIENKSIYFEKNQIEKKIKKDRISIETKRKRRTIFTIIFLLLIISTLNLYSVAYYEENSFTLGKYLFFVFIGAFSLMFFNIFNYKIFKKEKMIKFIYSASILLLIFVFIGGKVLPGVVKTINGATGWIRLGPINIQPAEILKVPFIIIEAYIFYKKENDSIFKLIGISFGIFLSFAGFIILQNDMGTVIHYFAIYLVMLFMSGIDKKVIIKVVSGFGILGIVGLVGLYKYGNIFFDGYKVRRITMYIDGLFNDGYIGNIDIGYQVAQSLLAFGNGGVLGVGYGNGVQKYSYLPEIHTDFIMALLGEEMGFLGVCIIVLFFFLLYNIMIDIGINSKDFFGKYLAIGIGGMIMSQVLINLFVAVGLLPVFGIPMPLFSYGGSSILTVMTSIGIVLSINNYTSIAFDKI
ncbi:MAG: FtsW/RodA/SpoVE family cell cycle protein [Fusobacterium perfoetens]|uniref:FtsW/RodA/SpoVE family cell cycle protein n=1 Tax=Fusobacterium perfoetens TaxID=852 RepID=UPI0023EFF0F7|nr:FtsW/RodA/SpoVE family cell cycle protein [Fusobacterium perfoetens]MCI6151786.1 FtsW/RodA/SpoVE family cell cycle protein [Fusobacterium perfoetens]MDY3236853.1 FtsW/RodA/SpoVE family cell cycle protein [Fusobacterium perfoetens]